MRFFRAKKIIIVACLILGATVIFQPKSSEALWGFDWLNAGIQVIGHAIQGALLGIDSAMNTVSASLQTVREFVNGLPIEYGPARRGLGIATATCDLIGGDLGALSTFDGLVDKDKAEGINFEELDDRLIIPDDYQVPNNGTDTSTPGNDGNVAGTSTVAGTQPTFPSPPLEVPKPGAPRGTNNEKLSTSLMTVGDQTKANLTLYISKKLGILKYRQVCYKTIQQTLRQSLVIAAWNEQLKQAYVDTLSEIEPRMSSINGHVAGLEQQLIKAKQDIFKAISASVAIDINEQKTTDAVGEIKPKLTVENYEKIIDALTKQVYAPAMIKKTYEGNKEEQLLMTALLNAELATDDTAKKQSLEIAQALVEGKLLTNCVQLYEVENRTELSDLQNIYSLVEPNNCNPVIMMNRYKEEFSALMAEARESARLEVGNGEGFLSTRTCKPVEEADKQKMTIASEAAKKLLEAQKTQKQYEVNHEMVHSEYIPAVKATHAAADELKKVAEQVDGGITEQCSAINDSGSLSKGVVQDSIMVMMDKQNQYNPDNPTLVSKNAETLFNKVFGGIILNPSKTPSVLTETGKSFLETIFSQATKVPSKKTSATGTTIPISNNNVTLTSSQSSSGSTKQTNSSVRGASTTAGVMPYSSPRGAYGWGL